MEAHYLHSLMEHFSDRIYFKDLQSRILYASKSYLAMFHMDDLAQIVGKTDADFFSPDHAQSALADEQEIIRTGQPKLNMQEKETWPDGSVTWSSTSKAPLRDDEGRIIGTIGISRDITQEKLTQETLKEREAQFRQLAEEVADSNLRLAEANQALEELSFKDPLTQLWNRRFLVDHLPKDIAAVDRAHRTLAADAVEQMKRNVDILFVMIDLDHFKLVNDQYGHGAGDLVLKQMAELLHRAARTSDMVVRVGGEEFLVVARHTARIDSHVVAERIRSAVEGYPFLIDGTKTIRCTCSVGFAVYPAFLVDTGFFSWEQIIEIADRCLYAAKKSGRNAWVGIVPDQSSLNTDRANLPRDVSELIASGALPVISSLQSPVKWT